MRSQLAGQDCRKGFQERLLERFLKRVPCSSSRSGPMPSYAEHPTLEGDWCHRRSPSWITTNNHLIILGNYLLTVSFTDPWFFQSSSLVLPKSTRVPQEGGWTGLGTGMLRRRGIPLNENKMVSKFPSFKVSKFQRFKNPFHVFRQYCSHITRSPIHKCW